MFILQTSNPSIGKEKNISCEGRISLLSYLSLSTSQFRSEGAELLPLGT